MNEGTALVLGYPPSGDNLLPRVSIHILGSVNGVVHAHLNGSLTRGTGIAMDGAQGTNTGHGCTTGGLASGGGGAC